MAEHSSIGWTDATWNPIAGCSVKSHGCTNCYAMPMARRHELMSAAQGRVSAYAGLTKVVNGHAVWTGELRLVESALTLPLTWRKPRKIFVNSMSDLFHENVPDAWIDRVFAVMALCPQHTFQVLTKRSARMRGYLSAARAHPVALEAMSMTLHAMVTNPRSDVGRDCILQGDIGHLKVWPLPNVWLGVSAEDQRRADERVPDLLATPAVVRFVSAEPLLGPVTFRWAPYDRAAENINAGRGADHLDGLRRLDWVIVGGEIGPGARPMPDGAVDDIRDQCAAAGVQFYFKRHGEWITVRDLRRLPSGSGPGFGIYDHAAYDRDAEAVRVGAKAAGRLLNGVEHNGMPEVRHD